MPYYTILRNIRCSLLPHSMTILRIVSCCMMPCWMVLLLCVASYAVRATCCPRVWPIAQIGNLQFGPRADSSQGEFPQTNGSPSIPEKGNSKTEAKKLPITDMNNTLEEERWVAPSTAPNARRRGTSLVESTAQPPPLWEG